MDRKELLKERVASRLKAKIASGRWGTELPGVRRLASDFSVSLQTMVDAMKILTQEGILAPAEPGKPRSLSATKAKNRDQTYRDVCILITVETMWGVGHLLIKHLKGGLEAEGFRVSVGQEPGIEKRSRKRTNEDILRRNPADLYIVIGSGLHFSNWIKNAAPASIFIGGSGVTPDVTAFHHSLSQSLQEPFEKLSSLGHKRIVVIQPPRFHQDAEGLSAADEICHKIFGHIGIKPSRYHFPRYDGTRDDLLKVLDQLFKVTPPTAVVLIDLSAVLTLMSFLIERGLRYPKDLSIITLDQHPCLEDFSPGISRVNQSQPELCRQVVRYIAKLGDGRPDPSDSKIIKGRFEDLGSIGKPRR